MAKRNFLNIKQRFAVTSQIQANEKENRNEEDGVISTETPENNEISAPTDEVSIFHSINLLIA
jgi:hypothetical protein